MARYKSGNYAGDVGRMIRAGRLAALRLRRIGVLFYCGCAIVVMLGRLPPLFAQPEIQFEAPGRVLKGQHGHPNVLAFSPDGSRIAVGGADGVIVLWDFVNQRVVSTFKCAGEVTAIEFFPDGSQFVAAGRDGTVAFWNIKRAAPIASTKLDSYARSLTFAPDGKLLISASADGVVRIWSADGKLVRKLDQPVNSNVVVLDLPAGTYIAAMVRFKLKKWKLTALLESDQPEIDRRWPQFLQLSPDGRWFAFETALPELPLYGLEIVGTEDGKQLGLNSFHPTVGPNVAFSLDGKIVAVQNDADILIDNVHFSRQARVLRADGRSLAPVSIVFSRDSARLAAGFNDGKVRIWSLH